MQNQLWNEFQSCPTVSSALGDWLFGGLLLCSGNAF